MSVTALPKFNNYDPAGPITSADMTWAKDQQFTATILFNDERLEVLSLNGAVLSSCQVSDWMDMQESLRDYLRFETDLADGTAIWFNSYSDALITSRAHVREGHPSAVVSDSYGSFEGFAVLVNRSAAAAD